MECLLPILAIFLIIGFFCFIILVLDILSGEPYEKWQIHLLLGRFTKGK